MTEVIHYVAAVTTETDGRTYEIVIAEADEHVRGINEDTGDEIIEFLMSDRGVLTIDTGIRLDLYYPDPSNQLAAAGWTITGHAEASDNAIYYAVEPKNPGLVAAPELPDERIREILAQLNAHEAHAAADRSCGCNPFEDIILGLAEYDGYKTEARFALEEEAAVLVDGTEVTTDHDGLWSATRFQWDANSLDSGDLDDRPAVWVMDSAGSLSVRSGDRWSHN